MCDNPRMYEREGPGRVTRPLSGGKLGLLYVPSGLLAEVLRVRGTAVATLRIPAAEAGIAAVDEQDQAVQQNKVDADATVTTVTASRDGRVVIELDSTAAGVCRGSDGQH